MAATAQQQTQYDVLWQPTDTNPLLPYSAIASQNKSLATNAKQIIKSINEVFKNNQSTQISLDSFISNFNILVSLVGDTYADATLLPKLTTVGNNIILAINNLDLAVDTLSEVIANKVDSNITDDINVVLNSIRDSIGKINSSVETLKLSGGGQTVAQEIINLGACNLPSSSTSMSNSVGFLAIPPELQGKIDFSKPPRIQIFASCSGNVNGNISKSFNALIYDSANLDSKRYKVGYTTDKSYLAILVCNSSDSMYSPQINLIIE